MRRIVVIAALALAGCGPAEPQSEPDTLPQPSGPPVAQAPPEPPAAPQPAPAAPQWEMLSHGGGASLRIAGMSIDCTRSPSGISVSVAAFAPIGSEDRFMLGLGEQPVTLVAAPDRQPATGVSAAGPLPDGFADLLSSSGQVTALYGTQRAGPFPAPEPRVASAFAEACSGRK